MRICIESFCEKQAYKAIEAVMFAIIKKKNHALKYGVIEIALTYRTLNILG